MYPLIVASSVSVLILLGGCQFPEPELVQELPACAADDGYSPNPATGQLYRAVDQRTSWTLAEIACEADGAHLAVIDDLTENAYVFSLLGPDVWIGLSRIERQNDFEWVNDRPFDFDNWRPGEPNDTAGQEDFIELVDDGKWNDIADTDPNRFICECELPAGAL